MESGLETVALEQRAEVLGVGRGHRDVVTGVGAEPVEGGARVVAVHAGVDRHDEPVPGAHAGHAQEHVAPERARAGRVELAGDRLCGRARRLVLVEVDGVRLADAVVGGHRAVLEEVARRASSAARYPAKSSVRVPFHAVRRSTRSRKSGAFGSR